MRIDFYLNLYYKVKPIRIKNLIYKRLMILVYREYGEQIKNCLEWCEWVTIKNTIT